MQATLGYNKTQVERTTTKAVVPQNDIAKLMYYLNCVATVLQYDINYRFRDYRNYFNLTQKEKDAVVVIALLFNPEILIDCKVFILDPTLLVGEFDNEFYKITDENIGIHVNEEVMIGGRQVRVLKIMACNENWIRKNYLDPIENINNRKKNVYIPTTSSQTNFVSSYEPDSSGCCECIKRNKKCCIIIIIIIVIIGIIDIIYYSFFNKKDSKES